MINRSEFTLSLLPLLEIKFQTPLLSHTPLTRPRLHALLNEGITHKVILVSAPAGFGKTTLLANWVRTTPGDTVEIAWLSLDKEDNRQDQFWEYVLTSLERVQPGISLDSLDLLHSPDSLPFERILIPLINAMNNLEKILVLVLDDYNLIEESTVHRSLEFLVDYVPARAHIILATRSEPALPLARWRARDELVEIRTRDLRCTDEETALFFAEVMHLKLSVPVVQEMNQRAEGWMAGLQLIGLALRNQADPSDFLQGLSGSRHYILDYLTDEVLRRQPEAVQSFLLRTSILSSFNAALSEAVTGQRECQAMLEYLEKENLFLVPLDQKDHWYRYHALFAQALGSQLEQLGPEQIKSLHRRAAQWHFAGGNFLDAAFHAIKAQNWELAVTAIESMARALPFRNDELPFILRMLEEIPMRQLVILLAKKPAQPSSYLDALLAAFHAGTQPAGRLPDSPDLPVAGPSIIEPLTAREMDVLHCLGHGLSNQEIARELVISIDTVKRHITNILEKLGVTNRTQAVVQARSRGLLDSETASGRLLS